MPVNLPNFLGLPIQGNPLARNAYSNFQEGVEGGFKPFEKQQDLQKAIYDNLMKKAAVPYAPEMAAYERDIKLAESKAAPLTTMLNNLSNKGLASLLANPSALKTVLGHFGENWQNIGSQAGYNTGGNFGYIPPNGFSGVRQEEAPIEPSNKQVSVIDILHKAINENVGSSKHPKEVNQSSTIKDSRANKIYKKPSYEHDGEDGLGIVPTYHTKSGRRVIKDAKSPTGYKYV